MPSARWFALVAEVAGRPGDPYVFGTSAPFEPRGDGQLILYANDAPFAYWNNFGSIEVRVTRVAR